MRAPCFSDPFGTSGASSGVKMRVVNAMGGDVVIIGAGLIGLATAFDLAERGATVRVYERAEPGRGASWAGAGMLAPYTERVENQSLLELCASSLALYPAFVERVRTAGGIDAQLHLDGIMHAELLRILGVAPW